MSALLASVRDLSELRMAEAGGADILDFKDARRGALGALPLSVLNALVSAAGGERPCSATVGDLPMQPLVLQAASKAVAGTGVDFVKVGLFRSPNCYECIASLASLARVHAYRLVGVLFADQHPDLQLIDAIARAGFYGVMLDTADKANGGLRAHWDDRRIGEFLDCAQSLGLYSGLAGSLTAYDIAPLLRLRPDYLGFRGALCDQGDRAGSLSPAALASVRAQLSATVTIYT